MKAKTPWLLALSGVVFTLGMLLGLSGFVPGLVATVLCALGLTLGSSLCALQIARVLSRRRQALAVRGEGAASVQRRMLVDELVRLCELSRSEGLLALAEADGAMLGGLVGRGAQMVINAPCSEDFQRVLVTSARPWMEGRARKRHRAVVATGLLSVLALGLVFVALVWATGWGGGGLSSAAGIQAGAALALLTSVYGAFALAVITPALADHMRALDADDASCVLVVIDGLMAVQGGASGASLRTLLELEGASGIATTAPPTHVRAHAA